MAKACAAGLGQGRGQGGGTIRRIDGAAGKDELLGHECRARAALAHQHLRHSRTIIAQQDEGCRIAYRHFVHSRPPAR